MRALENYKTNVSNLVFWPTSTRVRTGNSPSRAKCGVCFAISKMSAPTENNSMDHDLQNYFTVGVEIAKQAGAVSADCDEST